MIDTTKLLESIKDTNIYLDKTNLSQVLPLFCDFKNTTINKDSIHPCYSQQQNFDTEKYSNLRLNLLKYFEENQKFRGVPPDLDIKAYYNKILIAKQLKEIDNFYNTQSLDYKYCLQVSRKFENSSEEAALCMDNLNNNHKEFNEKFELIMQRKFFNF